MSWDPGIRFYDIHIDKKIAKDVLLFINDFNKGLREKFKISYKPNEEINICITEQGFTKYGMFGNENYYDEEEFIKLILKFDRKTGYVIVANDNYLVTDADRYFYEDEELVVMKNKAYEARSYSKEEKLEKVKEDFDFFVNLSDDEKKEFDYQWASLEARYPSSTWEFGSYYQDLEYSDEFLDNEEVVKRIFETGTRCKLLEMRVPKKYKENDELMKKLLPLSPDYITALPYRYRDNKKLVLDLLKSNTENNEISLKDVSLRLRNDKKVVLEFLKKSPYDYEYVSDRLKGDVKLIEMIKKIEPNFFKYTSIKKDNNKEITDIKKSIKDIIKKNLNIDILQFLSYIEELQLKRIKPNDPYDYMMNNNYMDGSYFDSKITKLIIENKNSIENLHLFIKFLKISLEEKKKLYIEEWTKINNIENEWQRDELVKSFLDCMDDNLNCDEEFITKLVEINPCEEILNYVPDDLINSGKIIKAIYNVDAKDSVVNIIIKQDECDEFKIRKWLLDNLEYQKHIQNIYIGKNGTDDTYNYIDEKKEKEIIEKATSVRELLLNIYKVNIETIPKSLKEDKEFLRKLVAYNPKLEELIYDENDYDDSDVTPEDYNIEG